MRCTRRFTSGRPAAPSLDGLGCHDRRAKHFVQRPVKWPLTRVEARVTAPRAAAARGMRLLRRGGRVLPKQALRETPTATGSSAGHSSGTETPSRPIAKGDSHDKYETPRDRPKTFAKHKCTPALPGQHAWRFVASVECAQLILTFQSSRDVPRNCSVQIVQRPFGESGLTSLR